MLGSGASSSIKVFALVTICYIKLFPKIVFTPKAKCIYFLNDLLCIHTVLLCSRASDSVHLLGKSPNHERNGKGISKGFLFDKGSSIFDTSIELKSAGLTPA